MLYRQKFDTFIRRFDDVGYIVSKSNFSDRVVDAAGAVFLTALSRKNQTLDDLVAKIAPQFVGVDTQTLKNDAMEFYATLVQDGLIVSGDTEMELDRTDTRFSYKGLGTDTVQVDFTPPAVQDKSSSQIFLAEHFKDKPHLFGFQMELTSHCNERCVHCYIPHKNKLYDIDDTLYYSVLDQCRDMGILNLTLSGGEPMCHPHFITYLRKALEYDFAVHILTNLTLLNDKIVAEMKSNRLSSVQVSVYSMNPATHDAITQVSGSFEKTKAAILKLIDNDIPLQISCPAMRQNKNDCIEVMNWARAHKIRATIDYIMMARYDHTTDNLNNRLSLEDVGTVISALLDNDTEYHHRMTITDIQADEKRNKNNDVLCNVCIDSFCMVANGNIYPCPGWQDYVCGNVKEQSLREIWEHSEKVQYLRKLRRKDFPKCDNCLDESFCAMCMVRNGNEDPNGDFLKINEHFCKVAELNRKIVLDWKERTINSGVAIADSNKTNLSP